MLKFVVAALLVAQAVQPSTVPATTSPSTSPTTTSPTTTTIAAPLACPATRETDPPIGWRVSTAVGKHTNGRLGNGVELPVQGPTYSTWDPGLKVPLSRPWRRWGTDYLLRTVLCVLHDFRIANPNAARVLVGDLSLPTGGPFGREYGGLGHSSHQNGLDVDIYYPRRDRQEIAPTSVSEIDRALSQELVDRLVALGAIKIFVGRRTKLSGPSEIVTFAAKHDDHLHARFAKP